MKHALRIEITTHHGPGRPHVEGLVQPVESDDFDPEFRTVGYLAATAFDDLVVNGGLRQTLINLRDDLEFRTEDDNITMYFDGECIADECAWHVDEDYMDDRWIAKNAKVVA